MTWRQLVLTSPLPVIPLFAAWDGAVSGARRCTVRDLKALTEPLSSDAYRWKMDVLKGGGGGTVWLLGLPLR